jgi:uncharacterized protein YukE
VEPPKSPKSNSGDKDGSNAKEQLKKQLEELRAVGDPEEEEDEDVEALPGPVRGWFFRPREPKAPIEFDQYWYKDTNIQIKIPKPDTEFEILEAALQSSRDQLETMKRSYCRSKSRRYKEISDSYYHEIKRLVNAIEALKDVLASRGDEFRVYYTDREHPDVACRRIILDCFVAGVVYGRAAPETSRLRRFRDEVLASSAAGRWFVRWYYAWLGPWVAERLARSPWLTRAARRVLDPFVRQLPEHDCGCH